MDSQGSHNSNNISKFLIYFHNNNLNSILKISKIFISSKCLLGSTNQLLQILRLRLKFNKDRLIHHRFIKVGVWEEFKLLSSKMPRKDKPK
jgi:hypothetical protein